MISRRPLALLLDPDPCSRPRLEAALGHHLRVKVCADWPALLAAAARAPADSVVVVEAGLARPDARPPRALAALRLRCPALPVVALVDEPCACAREVLRLGRWRVAAVVERDPREVRRAAEGLALLARGRLAEELRAAVGLDWTSPLGRLVRSAADLGPRAGAARLARSLYVSQRSLLRECRALGVPGPEWLMGWLFLLHAAALLDDPGRGVGQVAAACGATDARRLRRATRRLLGCTPEQLRRGGGAFRTAVAAFGAVLQAATEPGPEAAPRGRSAASSPRLARR